MERSGRRGERARNNSASAPNLPGAADATTEHSPHRGDDHEPDGAFLGVKHARQPGVTTQGHHRAPRRSGPASCAQVGSSANQRCALRDGEDEDEVKKAPAA